MAATLTPNIGLKKPDREDYVSVVSDINDNMDKLDSKIGAVPQNKTVQGQIDGIGTEIGTVPSGKSVQDEIDDINMAIGSTALPTTAQTLTGAIEELDTDLDDKVDKVNGKGLSTNDFTDAYKQAVDDAASKVSGGTEDHIVTLDENGNIQDSGKSIDDFSPIDDTAGLGDTDLVYSADKVVKLFRSEHEDLTSGNAEQVIGKVASTEKGAYLYRRGMHLGNRCREKVVGGTVAWNQLVQNGNFASNSGWNAIGGTLSVSNNKATISITSDGNLQFYRSVTPKISGHKVAVMFMCKTAYAKLISVNWGASLGTTYSTTSLTPLGLIGQVSSTGNENLNIIVNSISNGDTVEIKNVVLFDLTAMFGSTVADALYAMETATPGSGVAWFRSLFPKDYYAYDAGSLQSVQAASKVIKDASNNTVHTYPFDTSLVLRGIPKLDSNNRLYYDGDEYESSGKVTRKYGIVDLGSLTWDIYQENSSNYFHATFTDMASVVSVSEVSANSITPRYLCRGCVYGSLNEKELTTNIKNFSQSKKIIVRDSSYSDAATFKTAMSGVYLIYELATPTIEQASPFTPIMSFDPKGTEEFTEWGTRDVAVPVGHITEYLTDPAKILNNIPLIEVEKESASVVTFSDGAEGLPLKELTVKVEPVQDLHGYDNPWPAGGGKNLLNSDYYDGNTYSVYGTIFTKNDDGSVKITGSTTAGNVANYRFKIADAENNGLKAGTYIITIAVTGTYTGKIVFLTGGSNSGFTYAEATPSTPTTLTLTVDNQNIGHCLIQCSDSFTPSGSVTVYPMIRLSSISDSTWQPYSNICPISGWTGAKITQTGKNLLDHVVRGYISGNVVRIDNDSEAGVFYAVSGETYTRSAAIAFDRFIVGRVATKEVGHLTEIIEQVQQAGDTWTATWTGWTVWYGYSSNSQQIIDTFQVELDASASAYEVPNNTSYPITFPSSAGTVYGGTLTVNQDGSGELVVDRAKITVTESTSGYSENGQYIATYIADTITVPDSSVPENLISNMLKAKAFNTVYNGESGVTVHNNKVFAAISSCADRAAFNAFVSVNPLEISYPLATPVTYPLTPVEVETLLGINNIWADTGNVSLTYRADTKKYIDAKIAELSAAITALGT